MAQMLNAESESDGVDMDSNLEVSYKEESTG